MNLRGLIDTVRDEGYWVVHNLHHFFFRYESDGPDAVGRKDEQHQE